MNSWRWSKHGGYAGQRTIERVKQTVIALGWTHTPDGGASPDGGTIRHGSIFTSPEGHRIGFSASYGVTKESNRYSIWLEPAESVSESKMKKTIKLNESQLRKLISEMAVDPDSETARQVANAFFDILEVDGSGFKREFVEHLDMALGDEAYYPVRMEDIDIMADAVASEALDAIANSPEFHEFIKSAVATVFRRALG